MIGLGTAAKLYPVFLLVPLIVLAYRTRRWSGVRWAGGAAVASWAARRRDASRRGASGRGQAGASGRYMALSAISEISADSAAACVDAGP